MKWANLRLMRILLISNYLPDSQYSMQGYAALLQRGFTRAGHEVRVLRPRVKVAKLSVRGVGLKWLGYIDKFVLFPGQLKKSLEWPDIVHVCDQSNAFYVKYIKTRPHVVTCHDLLAIRSALGEFPEYKTKWTGRKLQSMILDGLAHARNIVCDSDATQYDVLRLVPGKPKEVVRIYVGLNYTYEPMARREAARRLNKVGLAPDLPFILHVGGNQWYKNRLGVLKIFAQLRKRASGQHLALVMAGHPWTKEMRRFTRAHEFGDSVLELVDLANEDLRALYSCAEALLFPSLEEGFGWPVIEAQACGCPVVTSNRAPMTEIGGTVATYIDPLDVEAAAVAVASAIGSRPAVSGASLRNAARFSADAMIDGYLDLYARLLGGGASSGAVRSPLFAGEYQ
jgi:glycosyltransferase involved in cell wall biosynthesis